MSFQKRVSAREIPLKKYLPILTGFQGAGQAPEGETDERSQPTRQRANPDGQRTRNLKGEEYIRQM